MVGAVEYGVLQTAWRQPRHMADAAPQTAGSVSAAPAKVSAKAAGLTGSAANSSGSAASAELPEIPAGYAPEELAARTRAQYPDLAAPWNDPDDEMLRRLGSPYAEEDEPEFRFPWESEDQDEKDGGVDGVDDAKSPADVMNEEKCQTCAKRKYQDGSDDPGVSFKFATRIDPRAAQAAVRGHEMEHVVRERAKAKMEGRKVVSQSVTYHTGICPECGKFYVRGGTTRTVTAVDNTKDFLKKLQNSSGDNRDFDIA